MRDLTVYIHGKGGTAAEAEHYRPLFPDGDVLGFDYRSETPWDAKREFSGYFDTVRERYDRISVIGNSIGAYFAMNALDGRKIDTAFFISPIIDMERLITDMLAWTGVTERDLRNRKFIETPFGETLSWEYLCYVRKTPIRWNVPTHIFYGEKDEMTSFETVSSFAAETGATLDILKGGAHWFHTEEQMRFLDEQIRKYL